MNLSGLKVLVTGATGFIGSRTVEILIRDHGASVRALVRNFTNVPRIARFPLEMVLGDVRDEGVLIQAAAGCDVIIHAAFDFSGSERDQHRAAVGGTEAVLKAALAASVSRVVHISTISVYGLTQDGDLDEKGRRGKLPDAYSRNKAAAENIALRYHRELGVPVAVVQPTVVYGPFSLPWTVGPLGALKSSRVVLANGGDGMCNAVYVDDVVAALLLAASRPEAVGQVFLISAESPITWKDFYAAYEDMLGFRSTVGLTAEEFRALRRSQARVALRQSASRLLRSHEFIDFRQTFAPLRVAYELLKRSLPSATARRLKSAIYPESRYHPAQAALAERPIAFPDPDRFRWLASKTRVRIDKAKRVLGYEPRYDLAGGMHRTRLWAEWANLLATQ